MGERSDPNKQAKPQSMLHAARLGLGCNWSSANGLAACKSHFRAALKSRVVGSTEGSKSASTSAIAQISALLAQEFKCINRDEAYTFALFRDCGMLAMMSNLKSYRPVLPGSKLPAAGNVTASEDRLFGVNHARVGCQLAKNWLLPDEICQAILRHHRYSSPKNGGDGPSIMSDQRVALVLAAEAAFVTHKMGILSEEWRKGAEFALAVLDITQADLDRVTGDLSPALLAGR